MIPEGVMAGFAGPSGLARTGAVGISLPRETGSGRRYRAFRLPGGDGWLLG